MIYVIFLTRESDRDLHVTGGIHMKSYSTHFILITLLTSCKTQEAVQQNNCFIKDTIVDMAISSKATENFKLSPDTKTVQRAHQGLYNDVGFCSDQTEDKIKISYPDIVYGFHSKTKRKLNSFWAKKDHVGSLEDLPEEFLDAIPDKAYGQKPTIVLTYPWKDFSVGTRFTHIPENDTKKTYAIKYIDHATQELIFDKVPKKNSLEEIQLDEQNSRKLFIKIIEKFVNRVDQSGKHHVIPYVWGGSSFTKPYKDEDFYKEDGTWHRNNEESSTYSGYDCSEFIMRMAKIAGIDFPWKTTTAIERSLKPVNDNNDLQDGDIIWVPGHVMIASNIKRNELIESRAYASGYGCVHRISLEECFHGISTYDDLLDHYYNHIPVQFKNRDGSVASKKYPVKLLKLVD